MKNAGSKEDGSLRTDCPLKGGKGRGLQCFLPPEGWRAVAGRAVAAVYLQPTPLHNLDFHLPSQPAQGSARPEQTHPPSLRNVGPAPQAGQTQRVPPPPQSEAWSPVVFPLCQDPVSKSPESHFLPHPPLPSLPRNHLEFAFCLGQRLLRRGVFVFKENSISTVYYTH